MDINRLHSDELSYELLVRNLPVTGTVADKRILLRNAMRVEKAGLLPSYTPIRLNVESELGICAEKLAALSFEIKKFDINNKENEYKRIYSRLIHLNGRIKRILGGEQFTEELNIRCLLLLEDLTVKYSGLEAGEPATNNQDILDRENESFASILDEPNNLIPHGMEPTNNNQISDNNRDQVDPVSDLISFVQQPAPKVSFATQCNSNEAHKSHLSSHSPINSNNLEKGRVVLESKATSPIHLCSTLNIPDQTCRKQLYAGINNHQTEKLDVDTCPISHTYNSRPFFNSDSTERPLNVSSWNLSFNGESGSVVEFLQRIEEYRLSRGVSKDRLFRAAPELLRGTALNWFRSETIKSWDDLVHKLKEYFLPYDYEFSLNEEIRKRSQGPHEKVIVYIASMQNLFNRLQNRPDEEMRVVWIRRNLLPYIQNALALQSIRTVEQLTKYCRSIEETSLRSQQYCPPSTNYRNLLEPQLAYHKPSGIPHTAVISHETHNISPVASIETSRPKRSCWNCGNSGHNFRVCTSPRQKFCFKCGYRNVVVKDCPKCQGNEQSK